MPWYPSIASGFDPLAQQQQYYAGLNADIQRGNVNSAADAQQQQNQYLFALAGLRQRAAEEQADAQQQGVANAVGTYQFNQQMALEKQKADEAARLKQEQLTLGEAADITAGAQRNRELTSAEDLQAASDLASKGKYSSIEELQSALPNATQQQIKDLWDTNNSVRGSTIRNTAMANALADQLNVRQSLSPTLSKGPPVTAGPNPRTGPWWSSPVEAGSAFRNSIVGQPINTSWFDNIKQRAAMVDQNLAKLGLAFNDDTASVVTPPKTSLQDFGVIFNPKSKKYEPVSPDQLSAATAPASGFRGVSSAAAAPVASTSGPPPAAVAYLKAHPELSAEFDEKYGQGASAQVINQ